jgi:hypothetical protein
MNGFVSSQASGEPDVIMDGLRHALSRLAADPRREGAEPMRHACDRSKASCSTGHRGKTAGAPDFTNH